MLFIGFRTKFVSFNFGKFSLSSAIKFLFTLDLLYFTDQKAENVRWHTEVSNHKNPPEIYIRKFVKLTGHTYACNNLTSFAYAAHAITGNGNDANLLKSNFQNS